MWLASSRRAISTNVHFALRTVVHYSLGLHGGVPTVARATPSIIPIFMGPNTPVRIAVIPSAPSTQIIFVTNVGHNS